ncbi:class I SAM-dependent methyltransferase [Streptomyces sp. NPDC004059]
MQSLHVAPQLGPEGRLDVLDIQQEMLDHVMCRAERDGLATIRPTRSDARELPYTDGTFDAVYAVTALGEIPEPDRVLREAARVLAPGGRLVIGEFFDRHWIPFGRLHRLADAAGLHLTERRGPSPAYLARFRPCRADAPGHQSERLAHSDPAGLWWCSADWPIPRGFRWCYPATGERGWCRRFLLDQGGGSDDGGSGVAPWSDATWDRRHRERPAASAQ